MKLKIFFRNSICVLLLAAGGARAQERGEALGATVNVAELSQETGERAVEAPRELHAPLAGPMAQVEAFPKSKITAEPRVEAAENAAGPAAAPMLSGFPAILDDLRRLPADAYGAVGPQHVMTTLNSEVQIQTRTGGVVVRMTLEKFWSRVGPFTDAAFDPRVLYDAVGKRWITSAGADANLPSSAFLIAVSQTSDPTGNWTQFKIPVGSGSMWGDYPVLGLGGNWVTVSLNMFSGDVYLRTSLYAFNKTDLYAGTRATFVTYRDDQGPFVPVVDYDNTPNRLLLLQSARTVDGSGALRISDLVGAAGAETFTPARAVVAVADSWADSAPGAVDFAPQSGSPARLDAGDSRLQNCVLRSGSIWCAHTIFLPARAPSRSSIQWWQISASTFQVQQRGRIDDPSGNIFYAYPSIAVNRHGDALIGYSRFSANQFAGAYFAFRAAADPLNTLESEVLIKQGEAAYAPAEVKSNRWGDYSATVVDPADDLSFWSIQEYAAMPPAGVSGRWGTWWAQVTPLAPGAPACTYALARSAQLLPGAGGSATLAVTTGSGCAWMAASNASWITITGGSPASGSGSIAFTIAPNPSSSALRTGTVTVAGQTFTITEQPLPPISDLTVTALSAPVTAVAGGRIAITAAIRNQGGAKAGAFRLGFYFSTKAAATTNDVFTGSFCAFDAGLEAGASASCNGNVSVPSSLDPGVYFLAAIVDDQGAVTEFDESNNVRVADSGPITVSADPNRPRASAVVSAASFLSGPVAPGEIVTLFGTNLGPPEAVTAKLNDAGLVDTVLGETRVLFDGVPAPMIAAQANQVSVVAPFSLATRESTQLQVEYRGVRSAALTVPVVTARPALFTLDASGKGPGAILNQDGSINSPSQPAAPGSIVVLFATGAGQMDTPVKDGQLAAPPLGRPLLPVSVKMGRQTAEILYAGAAPGLVAGVIQINARVPEQTEPADAVAIELTVGSASTTAGVTLAVR